MLSGYLLYLPPVALPLLPPPPPLLLLLFLVIVRLLCRIFLDSADSAESTQPIYV